MPESGNKSLCTTQNRSGSKLQIGSGEIPQADKDLAQKALVDFNKGNYQQTLGVLCKLETTRSKDIKVKHNKAVCEFYKSGLTNTENFRKVLTDIISQSSNSKGHGRLPEWPGCVESSVAVFNLAVVSYHHHQYLPAIDLLTPLYAALESLEESVGIGVCLLLGHCYLRCSRPDHCLAVVCHTEATFLPQPLPLRASSPPHTPTPAQQRDRGNVGGSAASGATNNRGVSAAETLSGSASGNSRGGSTGQESLRRRLQMMRVRALTSLKALKPAAREFKEALRQAASAGNELELNQICIKSQLKFLRGRYLKALKVLNNCAAIPPSVAPASTAPHHLKREWPSRDVWYYNNVAAIHIGLNKPALALMYMEKAIDTFVQESAQKKRLSLYDACSRLPAVLSYNLGCVLLRLNTCPAMARKAFDSFTNSLQTFPDSPRLWLHLAQCCIAVHKWDLQNSRDTDPSADRLVVTLGAGPTAKLLLRPHPCLALGRIRTEALSDAAFPEPRLQFGRLCLLNALVLLPARAPADADDCDGGEGKPPEFFPCSPSLPLRVDEASRLRCAALCCAAYTCLRLSLHQQALNHASLLLAELASLPHISPTLALYRFLARVYASQSCVMLDKLPEAIKYLDLQEIAEKGTSEEANDGFPAGDNLQLTPGYVPQKPQEQLSLLQFNLCVVYSMREEYDKADSLLESLLISHPGSKPTTLVMLSIYLHLRQGRRNEAREVVRTHLMKR